MTPRLLSVTLLAALAWFGTAVPADSAMLTPRRAGPAGPRGPIVPGPSPVAARAAFSPGVVLAIPRESASIGMESNGAVEIRDARLRSALARVGLEGVSAIGARIATAASSRRATFLRLTSTRAGFDPVAAADELRATGLFRAVTPDYRMRLGIVPNDPYLFAQWHVQTPNDADVDLPEAWDVEQGDTSVVIGIMDTGVDLGHEDLAGQIWTNRAEIPGNSLDDDGNGYIDDVHGYDFGNDDNDPNPHDVIDPEVGLDIGFHGTFVAGIASAATHNGIGIAGAGWKCRIMPLKVVDLNGDISTSSVTAAFLYATDMRPSVLNMSFGGPNRPGVPEYFQELVDDATAAGVLCVASAGNAGTDSLNYPAASHDVLSVGATDDQGDRASFSSFGYTVDVAAPGAAIWSSICTNYVVDDLSQIFYIYFFGWDGENPYMYGDGTSFAAPLVSGVCGLVRSRFPTLTPQLTALRIVRTGDVVAFDAPIGTKLNALRALTETVAVPMASVSSATTLECVGANPFSRAARLRYTLPSRGAARVRIYDCAGRMVRELASGVSEAGSHEVTWMASDPAGPRMTSGIYFARLETPSGNAMAKLFLVH